MAPSLSSSSSEEEEYEDSTGSDIILWYDQTRPRFIDLVGDYAGAELFLIEGDGLLRECFEDSRLDFSAGFQILHAVYIVEKFFQALLKRHCNFHVAFFHSHRLLCLPSTCSEDVKDRYLLTRSIVIRHLSLRLTIVKILTFESVESENFEHYLDKTGLHFVMLHDGASSANLDAAESPKTSSKESLRALIAWFNERNLNVALINKIEVRDTKVFTTILETQTSGKKISTLTALLPKLQAPPSPADPSTIQKWFAESSVLEDQSERFHLVSCSVAILLAEENVEPSLASAFLLHLIIMKHMKLKQRSFGSFIFESQLEAGIQKLLKDVSVVAEQLNSDSNWTRAVQDRNMEFDLIDLLDGRLFRATINALATKAEIPHDLKEEFYKVTEVIEAVTGHELMSSFSFGIPTQEKSLVVARKKLSVLPFANPVFDRHLALIKISTDDSVSSNEGRLKVFRDTTHWHNRKPVVQKKPPTVVFTRRRNPLRTLQFRMSEITAYAASLTGVSGKALVPQIVVVDQKVNSRLLKEKVHQREVEEGGSKGQKANGSTTKSKKGAIKKPVALSKAEIIKAANIGKKAGTESDKAFAAWQAVRKVFDEIVDDQQRYLKAKAYLVGLDAKLAHITSDVLLYQLSSLLSWWGQYCKANKAEGYHVIALLWAVAQEFIPSNTTKEIADHVEKICTLVGIPAAAESVHGASLPDRKLSFQFKYPNLKPPALRIELSEIEFQLLHCGPYMDRSTDGAVDIRVPRFIPDGWQRKVLDELDADHSIFVVAPTSSGKTFISFYAMEKVLKANNDDVLVYVAPTKSLVNQIAAEIQAQFSKNYPSAGRCVWAIHTRDTRINNPGNCQILVTVPHILQIMLLAPTNAKSWAPRVKRIIFDEIHSIGQAEDGVVWEQLLLMSPCPIIALSATVGNASEFRDWLESTQKASGNKLTMIQHHTRYSDLRKYTYTPPKAFDFKGLGKAPELGCALGLDGLTGLTFIHPVASLVDKTRGIPPDLSLEPRDCLLLWKAMTKYGNDQFPVPDHLAPGKALPSIIKKADTFKWEKGLKSVLIAWMNDATSPFDTVVKELSDKHVGSSAMSVGSDSSNSAADGTAEKTVDSSNLLETTMPLLWQLNHRNALPAILFNYDRSGCEDIGEKLLAQLTEAETAFKATSPSWKKTMKEYEKRQEAKEAKQRKAPKFTKQKGEKDEDASNKDSQMREEASSGDSSFYDLFDPDEPLPDFSFADKKKLQRNELEALVKQLRYKHISETLISLLYRGIGIHHSGLNKKYRQCVEMLFRKAFLRVVVATGTLSLGINMPCATVVFSGDSVFLTALNFRQAAGRSGRRNFDLLGNVVFQGITRDRVCRLLSSRLPDLTGHFPLTTSLVLRLSTLLHQSKQSPYAIKAIDALLSQPRMYLGGESFKEQVLHHLRFSFEYLRRQSLIGPKGEPVNFTSCVSHLYFTENSAFAFHALLKSDFLTSLCSGIDTKRSQVLRTLMLIMSHLFGRKLAKEVDNEEEAEKIRRSPSMVYLEPLPAAARDVLIKHNEETLDIFFTYAKTFAQQHCTDEEKLPLTEILVGSVNGGKQTTWLQNLPTPTTRSSFVALSGFGDTFQSVGDLCTSARDGIFLEQAVIPSLKLYPEETRTPLNAYLLDFYMHGSIKPLEDANGIRRSDVWFDLNDFSLVLATIVTSLGNYLGLGDSPDVDVMGMGDVAENDAEEDMAEEMLSGMASAQATASEKPAPPRRKLAEDWSLEEDALASHALHENGGATPEDDKEEYAKLMNVYKAFQMLKTEFDAKFRAIWA